MITDTCGDCHFYGAETPLYGTCRRNPPQVLAMPFNQPPHVDDLARVTAWPAVPMMSVGCGEFSLVHTAPVTPPPKHPVPDAAVLPLAPPPPKKAKKA